MIFLPANFHSYQRSLASFATLFCLLSATAPLQGQKWAEKMFKEKKHEFGTVLAGAKTEYRFVLENLYEETVHIQAVRSSCGCTSASIEKQTLKTWEKGAILATFNTDRFRGNRSAVLTVVIDKPFRAEVQLLVSGNIRGDIMVEPGAIQFGEVKATRTKEKTVRVTKYGNRNWQIVDVRSKFTHIGVRLKPVHRGYDSVIYDLQIQTRDTIPPGPFRNELILVTNDRFGSKIPITMSGQVMSALQVSPKLVSFGVLKTGESDAKKILLKSDMPFSITGIDCPNSKIVGQCDGGAKKLHFVNIEFKGSAEPEQINDQITISTDLNDQPIKLPVAVEIEAGSDE